MKSGRNFFSYVRKSTCMHRANRAGVLFCGWATAERLGQVHQSSGGPSGGGVSFYKALAFGAIGNEVMN